MGCSPELFLADGNYLQVDFIYTGKVGPSGVLGEFSAFVQSKPHYYR